MKKTKLFIVIATLALFILTCIYFFPKINFSFKKGTDLHSFQDIENEVKNYSFNYTYLYKNGGNIGVDGYTEHEIDYYFHDNDLDFDFYAKTLNTNNPYYGKQLYISFWNSYFEKIQNSIGSDIEDYIKKEFEKYNDIKNVEYKYDSSVSIWKIYLSTDRYNYYSNININNIYNVIDIYHGICKIIEKFDPNFLSRKKTMETWYNDEDVLTIRIDINGESFKKYNIDEDKLVVY